LPYEFISVKIETSVGIACDLKIDGDMLDDDWEKYLYDFLRMTIEYVQKKTKESYQEDG